MEKLQAALEKARSTREGAEKGQTRPVQNAKARAGAPGSDDLWARIEEFDTSPAQLEKSRIFTRVAGVSATPFDILRTKILLQMRQNGWKRIAVTSPMPNSGKTTTACNLALGLGRQSDIKSVLFDLDLRDPSVGSFFAVEPKHGIGDVLTGDVAFSEHALRFGSNVLVSMAKVPDTDPTRLLLAEETASKIDEIEREYAPDIMIFDLPSMLVNDDSRAFLKNVDCALIVVRAGKTRYGQFDTCEREIAEHTNVVGVVLNAYRQAEPGKTGE